MSRQLSFEVLLYNFQQLKMSEVDKLVELISGILQS
jgi:hypothetical protein